MSLAAAVATVAAQRSRGDLLNTYFDEAEFRARELYSEWEALASLTGETLERQKQNAKVVSKVVKMVRNGGIRV